MGARLLHPSDAVPLAEYDLPQWLMADLVRLGLDPERATPGAVLEAVVRRRRERLPDSHGRNGAPL